MGPAALLPASAPSRGLVEIGVRLGPVDPFEAPAMLVICGASGARHAALSSACRARRPRSYRPTTGHLLQTLSAALALRTHRRSSKRSSLHGRPELFNTPGRVIHRDMVG